MGNIAFVTSRKKITRELLEFHLNEINNRRFGGKFTISDQGHNNFWTIQYLDDWNLSFHVGTRTSRTLSMKWPNDRWIVYVFVSFKHELAHALGGNIRDESDDEVNKPNVEKYNTLQKWIALNSSYEWINKVEFYSEFIRQVPKDMIGY